MPIQTLFSALNPNDCDIVGVATERRHQDDQMAPSCYSSPTVFGFLFFSPLFCSFSLVTFVTERPRLRLDSPVTQQGGPGGILEKKILFFTFFFFWFREFLKSKDF